ncbi:type II secretion system protein [Aestuariibacter sp. A3R04]|uniref:type II secretion system protein n=1 Tax=Aestuariibacter sp. A3R04 TaxID=2841571 RepID=UPI001C09717E|nr:type II secretion system protein [Aestuariibacter sp. A3R04]MBU3020639.1 type II secretion system GspH family protein [Aestuariibacter sp. A3R04]
MPLRAGLSRPALFPASSGFTLLELVIVLVIVSALSVTAIARFQSDSGYKEIVLQKRLLSALRHMQLQAMYDERDVCYRMAFDYTPGAQGFAPTVSRFSTASAASSCHSTPNFSSTPALRTDPGELSAMKVTMNGYDGRAVVPAHIGFNTFGEPLTDGARCRSLEGCAIWFTGEDTVGVCINAEGHIYEC